MLDPPSPVHGFTRLGSALLVLDFLHSGPLILLKGFAWPELCLAGAGDGPRRPLAITSWSRLSWIASLCPRLPTPGFTFVSAKSQLLWQLDALARSSAHGLGLLTVSDRHHYSRQFSIGQKSCKA